jgi:hypothetical protein
MSFVYSTHFRRAAFAIGLVLPTAPVTVAFAQQTGGGGGGGGGGGTVQTGGAPGGGAPGGPGGTGGGSTTTTTTTVGPTQYFPGGVMPPPPGGTLGGGNAQYSSSKPITGNETDSFDFKYGSAGGTVHGGADSSFVLGGGLNGGATTNPGVHLVRRGDTLWGICDYYFRNPYQWPRIWSYNPQIQNPHWIYPGDQVRLKGGEITPVQPTPNTPGQSIIDRRKQVPAETVFLRNEGYIEDESGNDWGEINGSPEDKEILTDYDEAYLRIASDKDVKVGQELTVYRVVRRVGGGKLIEIQGTVRVDQWNPKERIARARVVESIDTIERGARVGPVTRRFEVVPPARDEVDLTATILTSVVPHVLYGQEQVVFIDKGEEAGLKPGNRLFILKKGDAWHDSLTSRSSARRIALEDQSPAATETIPRPRNDDTLPEEVQAELRVINVKKKTAMCIVKSSHREIEAGDKAYSRKGY